MRDYGDTLRDVSVVIASVESARSIARCIDSITDAVRGTRSELIVVDASRDESANIAEAKLGHECVLRYPPGRLTPELWAAGIARSTGRIVVLTTGHFDVKPTWIARLVDGLTSGRRGVAGRIDLADETSIVDWATYYLRYSEFVSEPQLAREVKGIPADNAAYDGDEIRRFVANSADGFWEVEFHRQIHASGGSLALVNGAPARYGRSFPFRTILAHRFHHGRHSGAWRVGSGERPRLFVVTAAPLVPFVLAARVWRRVKSLREHRRRFLTSVPVFLALAGAWAAGECVGAFSDALVSRRPRFVSV
jgi:glycosyltransferase involved in cell wall biosynthesis